MATINIDQAWLDARGTGPYTLTTSNDTYVLQVDVSVPGTAFAIFGSNTTLDLNGHTITYDNSAPITIANNSFEAGSGSSASDWTFSGAPNMTRFAGVFLHNEVYDGSYSIKCTIPCSDQYIESVGTITLEANTRYSLSGMFEYGGQGDTTNPGVKMYVRLVGAGLPTRECFWNASNFRGIQLREGLFTTGGTSETYSVRVGVEGGTGRTTTACYFDKIEIQKTSVYGLCSNANSYEPLLYPGFSTYGRGTGATFKNGTVIQGAMGSTFSHGVSVCTTSGVTIRDLNVTVNGKNSSCIHARDQSTFTSTVLTNTCTSNVKTITSRDQFNGAVIYGFQGTVANNTILNGPHAGIILASGTGANPVASQCYNNTIYLKSKYTNGFAITCHAGSQVYSNTINCGTGEYAARGIGVGGLLTTATTRVYSNTIHVQQLINNQEYEGQILGGAYGIQAENSKNSEIYNNYVYAHGNEVTAYAFRMNSDTGTSDQVYVHNNYFEAISNGVQAACTKFSAISASNINFDHNTLVTNDGIVGASSNSVVTLKRSTISGTTPLPGTPRPFDAEYSAAAFPHCTITFTDNTFSDQTVRDYVEDAVTRVIPRYGGAITNAIVYNLSWTTVFQATDIGGRPIAGVTISVVDTNSTVVASGTTDAQGKLVATILELKTQGSTKTPHNNHTVTATFGGRNRIVTFVANKPQTIYLRIGKPPFVAGTRGTRVSRGGFSGGDF